MDRILLRLSLTLVTFFGPAMSVAHADTTRTANTFGMPGVVEMPSALGFPDADVVTSLTFTDQQQRTTLAFQITPRLTGAFRYSRIDDFRGGTITRFDRSFDLHYRLLDEGGMRPAVAIGLRDFIGTGVFSSEYLVASKHLSPDIVATAGIGWGALATRNGFENPVSALADRPGFEGVGGEANLGQWFRGDAALFAGVSWAVNDRLTVSGEYASDGQDLSASDRTADDRSPFNFGLQYQARPGLTLATQYLQGDTIGASAHFTLNPRVPPAGGDRSPAPAPIAVRGGTAASWAGDMRHDAIPARTRVPTLAAVLEAEGLQLRQIARGHVRPRAGSEQAL